MPVVAPRAVVRLALFVLALVPSALAQTGDAPSMADDGLPLLQMPALNAFPSKHDEASVADNDIAGPN